MFATGILLLLAGTAYAYNVDTNFPIIFSYGNASNNGGSYFGYTVFLYSVPDKNISWLIIGAPKANYSTGGEVRSTPVIEPGVVYRCSINSNDECHEIRPESFANKEEFVPQLGMSVLIRQQHGWFGSAISVHKLGEIITVCAPRTIMVILNPFTNENLETMQGMCYSGELSENTLSLERRDLQFHNFKSPFWYNPLHGFSLHYAPTKNKYSEREDVYRLVGQPKHESDGTVQMLHSNVRRTIELSSSDALSQFGYSVESGYFFKKDQLLFASGAPGWRYVGLVAIYNPLWLLVTKLQGTEIGEYFGASLAVGDLNNDGLDDLLIGAPYWGEDNGRVYAYFGTTENQFEIALTLHGSEGSHFGYVLASGDLDADGHDDIIVGAPWEDDGVVYIYNGGPNLKDMDLQTSQRIEAKTFPKSQQMQRFGFSISKPTDIDGNGYLDIAVGAYKSQDAVIFRGKPVVQTELVMETVPKTLPRNADKFLVKIYPKYSGYSMRENQAFKITVIIDERYQRTTETVLELKRSNLEKDTCLSAEVNISKNVRDFIEPIRIIAKHEFVYDHASTVFCLLCPVEKQNNKLQTAEVLLPFNINCGEDKVCNSKISATARFHNVRDNNTWIIGSSDISLEIYLTNDGEPAYLTTLEFTFPEGVVLRSILPSCQEDTSKENLIVTCDAGNPLWKDEEKNVTLNLDMRQLHNPSGDDRKLHFNITINTRSINHGTTGVISTLSLVNEVSLSLHGEANEEAYYFTSSSEMAPNISFQHSYQVYKLGESPVQDAQMIVKVPVSVKNSQTLVYIYKPRLYISGKYFSCSSENTFLNTQLLEGEVEGEASIDDTDMSVYSSEPQENGSHILDKRDTKKSILSLYGVEDIRSAQNLSSTDIYINCSTPDVNCVTITCSLNALQTLQDVGKMVTRLVLDISKLKDHFEQERTVLRFSTKASVEIIKPASRLQINGTRSTVEIVTTVHAAPKVEKLQLWIVMVSVLVGLLLLLIFAAILSTMGFFKRKEKEEPTVPKDEDECIYRDTVNVQNQT